MGNNLARQLTTDHLVAGEMRRGEEIALKIDQFLLHDATGPLCALQLQAMGIEQISGDTAVATGRSCHRMTASLHRNKLATPADALTANRLAADHVLACA